MKKNAIYNGIKNEIFRSKLTKLSTQKPTII